MRTGIVRNVLLLLTLVPTFVLANERPNVVLIMADDMGYECLGCNGSTYSTPNLDRLASEGIRFTKCYSQPLCTPTRVKVMTGKYNFRNYQEFGYLNPAENTFGHALKKAGYKTAIAGKWQLNGLSYRLDRFDDSSRPLDAGFDEYCLWQLTQPKTKGERFADALLETTGQAPKKHIGEYGPQVLADFVCNFIERNRDQPFFVYYPMVLTHDPFVPTPDSAEWETGNRMEKNKKYFADMVAYTDRIVGQIDSKLEELGLRENTILLFTADNGTHGSITTPMRDGRNIKGGKGSTLDTGNHVPMVASWPGTAPKGMVNENLIGFTDFFASVTDAAGVPDANAGNDGVSFLPMLKGEKGMPRDFLFCHYDARWGNWNKTIRFSRSQNYKLYADGRLFRTGSDEMEKQPLNVDSLEAREAQQYLQKIMDSMPPVEHRPRILKQKKRS